MSPAALNWATIQVLWRRDLRRFWRQPTRIVGALGQPVIFWGIIGSGMDATFVLPGSDMSYRGYFFPGVVMMVVLFASIFASVSVIEDRHHGFLQAVLAGPAAGWALAVGKCLGSASVALVQAALFLALAPLAGISLAAVDWPLLGAALTAAALGLSAVGFAVAWALDNVQAYHAVQMTLLVPLWVISGAMFPTAGGPKLLAWASLGNPLAYALTAVRAALTPGAAAAVGPPVAPLTALAAVAAFATVALALGGRAVRR